MPVSDLTIDRCARRVIQLCGSRATARAREIVEEMRRKGDNEGADTWLMATDHRGDRRARRAVDRGTALKKSAIKEICIVSRIDMSAEDVIGYFAE